MKKFSKINESSESSEYHYIENQEIIDVFQELIDCDYSYHFSNMYMDADGSGSNRKCIFKKFNPFTDVDFKKLISKGTEEYLYDGSIRFKQNSDEVILFHECVLRLRIMYPKLIFLTSQRDGSTESSEFVGFHLRIVYDRVEDKNKVDPKKARNILDSFKETLTGRIDDIDKYYFRIEQKSDYFLMIIRINEDSEGIIGKRLVAQNKYDNKESILSLRNHLIEYCKKNLPDYTPRVMNNNIRYDQDIVIYVQQKRNFLMDKTVPKDITLYMLEIAIDF